MTTMTPEREMAEKTARLHQREQRASSLSEQLGLSPEVEQEFEEKAGAGIRPVFGYYRTGAGEIMVGLTSEMEELYHRREGWLPLPEYGYFDNTSEYTANHPFEALFMKGGSLEFPVSQVIENGWHITAPTVPGCLKALDQHHKKHTKDCFRRRRTVIFPQLEGVDVQPAECEYCGRICQTKAALRQHMTVMHNDELGELRTGNALAEALTRGLAGLTALPQAQAPVASAPASFDPNGAQEENLAAVRALAIITQHGLTKAQLKALQEAGIAQAPEGEDPDGNQD